MQYRKIPLTQGKFAKVDIEDFELVSFFTWQLKHKKNEKTGYARCALLNCSLHNFLMTPPRDKIVDHKNGDGLDNRRSNLRLATHSQNQWNMLSHTPGKLKGVYYSKNKKRIKRFYAQIQAEGKTFSRGMFHTAIEAHEAYIKLAKEKHGSFARWK